MKSAYIVMQGYAQFCKMISMVIIGVCLIAILTNFLEICIPLCNDPIGLIQKGHLNSFASDLLKVHDLVGEADICLSAVSGLSGIQEY